MALLAYCLPRKALLITGKNADESIWVKGKEATEVVERSKTDYKSKSVDELIALFGHPIPQVTRAAVWALHEKEGGFIPKLTKLMKEGTKIEKESAIGYFGWKCPTNQALAQMELIGRIPPGSSPLKRRKRPELRNKVRIVLSIALRVIYPVKSILKQDMLRGG